MRLSFLKVAMGGMKNLSPGWFEHTAKHLRCLQGLSETNCRGCKQKQQEAANLRRSCFSGMLFRTEQRSFVMRLQYASDLHLEIPANRDFMLAGALEPAADYLLLAGDISSLTDWCKADAFWDWCAQHFRQTWIVPGNHDYYADKTNLLGQRSLELFVRPNVAYANNVCVQVKDVSLVLTTLWSEIVQQKTEIEEKVVDYRQIYFDGKLISTKLSIVCIRKAGRFWIERFRYAIRIKPWWSRTTSLCLKLRPHAT